MKSRHPAVDAYMSEFGEVPRSVELAEAHIPKQLSGYLELRKSVLDGALPQHYASLILCLADVLSDNEYGAVHHARLGLRRGLTWDELMHGLTLLWLVNGFASTWGRTAWRIVGELEAEGWDDEST